jgi:hypothetical protein
MNIRSSTPEIQIIEARLSARLAGGLTAQIDNIPHDISERLRFAREKSLARSREVRLAAPASHSIVGVSARGAAVLAGFVPWWQRAASALPLVMLVIGFMVIDHWAVREQVVAAADFDAQLLADDLPPAAYSDPGFAEFLRDSPKP